MIIKANKKNSTERPSCLGIFLFLQREEGWMYFYFKNIFTQNLIHIFKKNKVKLRHKLKDFLNLTTIRFLKQTLRVMNTGLGCFMEWDKKMTRLILNFPNGIYFFTKICEIMKKIVLLSLASSHRALLLRFHVCSSFRRRPCMTS